MHTRARRMLSIFIADALKRAAGFAGAGGGPPGAQITRESARANCVHARSPRRSTCARSKACIIRTTACAACVDARRVCCYLELFGLRPWSLEAEPFPRCRCIAACARACERCQPTLLHTPSVCAAQRAFELPGRAARGSLRSRRVSPAGQARARRTAPLHAGISVNKGSHAHLRTKMWWTRALGGPQAPANAPRSGAGCSAAGRPDKGAPGPARAARR